MTKLKQLEEAWARFRSRMAQIQSSLAAVVRDMRRRRKKKLLEEAWARFQSKLSGIRSRTLGLVAGIDRKRSEKAAEEVRRNLGNT